MTISLVGSAGNGVDTGNVAVTLPAGISNGDVIVAVGVCSNAQTLTAPGGWTVQSGWPKDSGSARTYLWLKDTVTSGDSSASVTFTSSGANKIIVAAAVYHSTVGFPANPLDVTPAWTAHSSGTSYVAPQVTSATAGCWGVAAFTVRGTDPTAWTPASGLTERQDRQQGAPASGGQTSLHLCDSNGSIGAASTAWGTFSETNISATTGGGLSLLLKETSGGGGASYPVIGLWRNHNSDSWRTEHDTAESIYGVFQGHWSNYHGPGSLPLNAAELQAIADGKRLHIMWKPYPAGQSWGYTAAGSYNASIDQVAASIKSVDPAVVDLTLHHEPEDDYLNHGSGGAGWTAASYRGMWQKVRDRFNAAGVTNVRWLMVFQNSHSHPSEMITLWGNDGVMDGLVDGVSQQDYITKSATASTIATKWVEDLDFLVNNTAGGRNWSETSKPQLFTEWGADLGGTSADRGTNQHRADTIAAIQGILSTLAARNVEEIVYFDAGSNDIDDPPAVDGVAFQALKNASEAGQVGGGGGGGSPGPIVSAGFALANDGLTSTTQTIGFTLPAGWQTGDYALAFLSTNSRPDITSAPAGWELIKGPTDNSTTQRAFLYARRLVSGDPNPSWTLSQSVRPSGVLGTWRGVDPTTPIHASTAFSATASSTSQAAPAVTTTLDSYVITAWLARWTGGSGTNYGTAPGGTHTTDASASTNPGTNPGASALLAHVTADPVTAGTYGAYTATYGTACTGLNIQLALLPAATTPGPPAPPDPPVTGELGVPPDLLVLAAFGNPTTTDPQAGFLVLNVGPPLDTGLLGGINWVEVTGDVRTVSYRRGKAGELESSAPGGIDVTLDNASGAYDPANIASPWYGQLDVGAAVWVRATWGDTYDLAYAYLDSIDLELGYEATATLRCVDGLEVLGRAELGTITSSFDNDLSGVRLGRLMDGASWPVSLRSLDDGRVPLQATTYGDFALPLCQEVLDTELGILFAAADGKLTFHDRYHQITNQRSLVIQANLTDTAGQVPGSTEVEMERLTVSLARDTVFNRATVTRTGGTEQTANNTTSQARYGIRSFPGSPGTLLRSDNEALNLAQWLVGRYPTPKLRVSEVQVDASTQDLWQVLLPLTLQDRIRVTRDYGANTIQAELHIQGMTVDIDAQAGTWRWTLQTSSPNLTAPILLNIGPPLGTGELGA